MRDWVSDRLLDVAIIVLIPLGVIGVLYLIPAPPVTPSSPAFAQDYAVEVNSVGSTGSGVVIGNITYNVIAGHPAVHSLIITCAHVVTVDSTIQAPPVVMVVHDGKTYAGRVIAVDGNADLALIDVAQHWQPMHLYTGEIEPGMREVTVGYPLGTHLQISPVGFVGQMNVSHDLGALATKHDSAREGSTPMWPGNSGGAVYVATHVGWQFIGLAKMIAEYPVMLGHGSATLVAAPSVSYFITADTIAKFLKAQHVE